MNAIKLNVLFIISWEVKIICKQNQICFVSLRYISILKDKQGNEICLV